MRVAVLLVVLAVFAASCTPELSDDTYTCTDDTTCPDGFRCAGGFCRNTAGTECRQDLQCDDGSFCTEDVCENGYCLHPPGEDGLFCDDFLSCNGADECRAGTCTNVGPPPCPGSCDEATGCGGECGYTGLVCCGGGTCFDESTCDGSNICTSCGGADQECCSGIDCNPGLVCVPSPEMTSTRCAECGGAEQPCCADGCDGDMFCVLTPEGGACRRFDCAGSGTSCSSSEICGDPGGFGMPTCIPCGNVGEPCCADRTCFDAKVPCSFGGCFPMVVGAG